MKYDENPSILAKTYTDENHASLKTLKRSLRTSHRLYLYSFLAVSVIYLSYKWVYGAIVLNPNSECSKAADHGLTSLDMPQVIRLDVGNSPYRTYSPRNGYYGGNVVQVEVYSEAQCGDSTRFTRRQLWPTYQKFEHTGRLQVSVISFGKASCQPEAGDFNCRCQHGQRECDLNQLMNCVQDFYNNDPGKYLPVFACIQGKTDLDYAKDYCIANNPELPLETIMKCTTGRRGRRLLALAGQKTAALQPPLNNVPLIRVNGVKSIDAFYEFEETICNEMQPKPAECAKYLTK